MEDQMLAGTRILEARTWDSPWESGDRFEVQSIPNGDGALRLAPPRELLADELFPQILENSSGQRLNMVRAPDGAIELADLSGPSGPQFQTFWLEYLSPGRYRLVGERSPV